jgi:hypothetical protein
MPFTAVTVLLEQMPVHVVYDSRTSGICCSRMHRTNQSQRDRGAEKIQKATVRAMVESGLMP